MFIWEKELGTIPFWSHIHSTSFKQWKKKKNSYCFLRINFLKLITPSSYFQHPVTSQWHLLSPRRWYSYTLRRCMLQLESRKIILTSSKTGCMLGASARVTIIYQVLCSVPTFLANLVILNVTYEATPSVQNGFTRIPSIFY